MMIKRVLVIITLLGAAFAHADAGLPSNSLYHLDAALTNQNDQRVNLDVHAGVPVLVTMFYATCPKICPLLIETVRGIEQSLTPAEREEIRVLMITLDPKRDTPDVLAKLARERRLDTSRWTLVTASESDIQKIAALLSTQYRRLPDGEFNHASIITLLGPDGAIRHQTAALGRPDRQMVTALKASIARATTP